MNKFIWRSILLCGCLSFLRMVHAETTTFLDPLVVTGTRSPQTVIAIPASVTLISADEISASGATSVVEVLRHRGGIQISDLYGDGSRSSVSLRGFGGNAQANTLILVDGRRLNNPDLGAPDLNSVSLKDVERIEILSGSAGVLYGDQAVGGVINIITRSPERFHARVDGSAASYHSTGATVEISNRHERGLGYRFSAEQSYAGNYRDHNDQDYRNLLGLLDYRHQSGTVFMEYQEVREHLQTPGALFADQVRTDRRQAFTPRDFIKTDTENFRWGVRQAIFPGWDVLAEYTVRRDTGRGILSVGGAGGPVLSKRDHRELTPRVTGRVNTPRGAALVTLGVDLYWSEFFLNSVLGSIADDQAQQAVYGQATIPLSAALSLTLGGRYARIGNTVTGALLPPDTEIDDDGFVGEAGLAYQPAQRWRLFARAAGNYRFVLADEYTSASFGGVIPQTQTGISYESGFDFTGDLVRVNLLAYRLDLDDEIDFDPVLFINTNIGDTRRHGLVLDLEYRPWRKLSLGMNYGYVRAHIVSGPLSGLDVPFSARHTLRLSAISEFLPGWHAMGELLGSSRRTATGDFFRTGAVLPGYVIANAGVRYQRGALSLGFRVNNLSDRAYSDNAQLGFRAPLFQPETVFFPAPGRNVLATFAYEFK